MKLKTYLKNVVNRLITVVFVLLFIFIDLIVGIILAITSIPLWPLTYILFGWSAPGLIYYVDWIFDFVEESNFDTNWIK